MVEGLFVERKYNKLIVPLAKVLRKNMTREEKHLWYDFLRSHPARFTRQKVLGKYIADFYSAKEKLIVEIDGSQHYTATGKENDSERTKYLEQYGLTVLRFTNREVNEKFYNVCECIDRHIKENLKNR